MPSDKAAVSRIIEKMAALPLGETRIMEVCGTHTMAIAKSGIRSMLPGTSACSQAPDVPCASLLPPSSTRCWSLRCGRTS